MEARIHQTIRDVESVRGQNVDLRQRSRSPLQSPATSLDAKFQPFLDEHLLSLSRTADVFHRIGEEKHMACKLPKPGLTAGRVLRHSESVFRTLMDRNYPMTFKFGITHCPSFRWHHKPYGYRHGLEKFDSMAIIFVSACVTGPAFLEAALISKFGSCLANHCAMRYEVDSHLITYELLWLDRILRSFLGTACYLLTWACFLRTKAWRDARTICLVVIPAIMEMAGTGLTLHTSCLNHGKLRLLFLLWWDQKAVQPRK